MRGGGDPTLGSDVLGVTAQRVAFPDRVDSRLLVESRKDVSRCNWVSGMEVKSNVGRVNYPANPPWYMTSSPSVSLRLAGLWNSRGFIVLDHYQFPLFCCAYGLWTVLTVNFSHIPWIDLSSFDVSRYKKVE